ncbi:MAG: peptidylprolyl isomerase [Candidatus Eisenbacteria bacterium]|nr:peptidylprolyl isomerase [Candidatus Eisenbacteria bacterium]
MSEAKTGDLVRVHYTGKLEDGTVFDSSEGGEPLEFTLGEGRIIPGVEEAVIGMRAGDAKTVHVTPEKGYGPHVEELLFRVSKDRLPRGMDPEVGQRYELTQEGGAKALVTVTEVDGEDVVLDGNHPLAGKTMVFDLEMVSIG